MMYWSILVVEMEYKMEVWARDGVSKSVVNTNQKRNLVRNIFWTEIGRRSVVSVSKVEKQDILELRSFEDVVFVDFQLRKTFPLVI